MFIAQSDPTSLEFTTISIEETTYLGLSGAVAFWLSFTFLILIFVAWWNVFEKAGHAGWKSLIPFYNTFTLFEIAGRNGWMFLLLLIPIVNIIVAIMLSIDIAHKFGKSTLFGVLGLWLFSIIGYFILGFGDAQYEGGKSAAKAESSEA